MPEKGWPILTVSESTLERAEESARARSSTVEEFINELVSPSGSPEWSTCSICGAEVKT